MTQDTVIRRSESWLAARVGDEVMMMHLDSSYYLHLSGTGGRIWELLETPRTLRELCNVLSQEFDVDPAEAQMQVVAFLQQLQARKAVDVATPALP